MSRWRFLDYYTDDEPPRNAIQAWYNRQEISVKAAFDATLTTLLGIEDWADKDVREFKLFKEGEFAGLGELRFYITDKGKKRKFRIPGIWRPEHHEFILLGGCEKSGRIKIPQDAFEIAMSLKLAWERDGRGSIHEHK